MKRFLLLFLIILFGGNNFLSAQSFKWVNKENLKHPYLFFNDQEKQQILDYIKNDKEAARVFEGLKETAKEWMTAEVMNDEFPEVVDGSRRNGRYQYMRRIRGVAATLAFLYQMTGDMSYARKSYEYAEAICEMPRWPNRYHEFRIIYDRVWPWGPKDDQVVFSVDLDATNNANYLALTYDWLYPVLTKREKDRLRGAMLQKAILPVKGNHDYHWWANAYKCNWCAVNNGNIGVAIMSILTENPELESMLKESYDRVSKTMDNCGVGGGWEEGYSYFNYAFDRAVNFAEPLKRITDGKLNLFKHRTLREDGVTTSIHSMVAPNLCVNFGDASETESARIYVINKIAEETKNGKAVWFRQNRLGQIHSYMDLIWRESKVKPIVPENKSHLFKSIGWGVLRTDFLDAEKPVIVWKAGYNEDPHHGHLDVGSYDLFWRGEGFIAELGHGYYDENYFADKRWETPHASNVGHQSICVNGELQIAAKLKDQPWKKGIGGKVLKFQVGNNRDYVLMDPTNAYPKKELKKWRRHLIFEKPEIFVVLDEISARPNSNVEVIFNTKVEFENKNDHVLLKGKKGKMVLIPVSKTEFGIKNKEHKYIIPQNMNSKEGRPGQTPYFTAEMTSKDEISYVFSIVAPYESEEEVSKIVNSAKMVDVNSNIIELTFTIGNKDYKYQFSKSKGGELLLSNI